MVAVVPPVEEAEAEDGLAVEVEEDGPLAEVAVATEVVMAVAAEEAEAN